MYVHVGRRCGVLKCLLDVGALQIGVFLEELLERPARGDQPHHGLNGDAVEHHREARRACPGWLRDRVPARDDEKPIDLIGQGEYIVTIRRWKYCYRNCETLSGAT